MPRVRVPPEAGGGCARPDPGEGGDGTGPCGGRSRGFSGKGAGAVTVVSACRAWGLFRRLFGLLGPFLLRVTGLVPWKPLRVG